MISPQSALDVINARFGRHPGYRGLHAKGILAKGTFTATPEAARLTRAQHMQGEPVPVTARLSNGGGDPTVPDYAPEVRGLAVKLYLPDGSRTDISAQTVPRFPTRTPDAFLNLVRASTGAARVWRLPLFLATHPEVLATLASERPRAQAALELRDNPVQRGARVQVGRRRRRRAIRPLLLVAEAEEPRLSKDEAKSRGRDYLHEEIKERLARRPVRFTLELTLAAPGDKVDDPTSVWPDDREKVAAGTLELTELDTDRERGDDVLIFDPTRVTDGIELSDDPVLRYRPAAYSESVERRTAR